MLWLSAEALSWPSNMFVLGRAILCWGVWDRCAATGCKGVAQQGKITLWLSI